MKKIISLVFSAIFLFLIACSSDDETPPAPAAPTIEVVRSPAEGPYKVGDNIEFTISLRTDPSVGIAAFVIDKEDKGIFSRSDYTSDGVNFTFTYSPILADLEGDEVVITFILTDNNLRQVTAVERFSVTQEYAYFQSDFAPNPSWDLVENVEVTSEDGTNVDITAQVSSGFGGPATVAFFAKNGTVLYNIDDSISFFDPNISTEQIVNAISNLSAEESLEISSANVTNQFPVVAKIRGKEVYAIISFANPGGSVWGYRKISEFAGR